MDEERVQLAQRDVVDGIHELVQTLLAECPGWKQLFVEPLFQPLPFIKLPLLPSRQRSSQLSCVGYEGCALSLLRATSEHISQLSDPHDGTTTRILQSLTRLGTTLELSVASRLAKIRKNHRKWFQKWLGSEAVPTMMALLHMLNMAVLNSSLSLPGAQVEPHDSFNGLSPSLLALCTAGALCQIEVYQTYSQEFYRDLKQEVEVGVRDLASKHSLEATYIYTRRVGLQQAFLDIFASRAAGLHLEYDLDIACHAAGSKGGMNEDRSRERAFWIKFLHGQLAEGIREANLVSRWDLQESAEESIQDLAIFGFFTALVHTSRSYLTSRDVTTGSGDFGSFLRFLEAAVVGFFPHLQGVFEYQHYLEIVSKAVGWLPFYPNITLQGIFAEDPYGQKLSQLHKQVVDPEKKPWAKQRQTFLTVQLCCAKWLCEYAHHCDWVTDWPHSKGSIFLQACLQRLGDNWYLQKGVCEQTAKEGEESEGCVPDLGEAEEAFGNPSNKLLAMMAATTGRPKNFGQVPRSPLPAQDAATLAAYEALPPGKNVLEASLGAVVDFAGVAWRGTKLWGTDMAVASSMLLRGAQGEALSDRDKKHLVRVVADLALLVPLGCIMAIPITPVGHAAVLLALQRWVPALVPSSFSHERLTMALQMEEMRGVPLGSSLSPVLSLDSLPSHLQTPLALPSHPHKDTDLVPFSCHQSLASLQPSRPSEVPEALLLDVDASHSILGPSQAAEAVH